MKHIFITIVIAVVALASSCSEYDDSAVREYTPEAIGDNSWTADIDTTIVEDKDVPGLPPADPEFRGAIVSRLSSEYEGDLTVTINDQSTEPSVQNVLIRASDKTHINFGLKNFMLVSDDDVMLVGTIVLKDIAVREDADGKVAFEFSQSINILPGDNRIFFEGEWFDLEEDDWVGPMLGPIPVKIAGIGDAKTMNISIDIVMEALDQVIHVDFIAK